MNIHLTCIPSPSLQLAQQLSLDTIVVNELKRSRKSEYEFSFKNAFALNQNNALLLHVGLCLTMFSSMDMW